MLKLILPKILTTSVYGAASNAKCQSLLTCITLSSRMVTSQLSNKWSHSKFPVALTNTTCLACKISLTKISTAISWKLKMVFTIVLPYHHPIKFCHTYTMHLRYIYYKSFNKYIMYIYGKMSLGGGIITRGWWHQLRLFRKINYCESHWGDKETLLIFFSLIISINLINS